MAILYILRFSSLAFVLPSALCPQSFPCRIVEVRYLYIAWQILHGKLRYNIQVKQWFIKPNYTIFRMFQKDLIPRYFFLFPLPNVSATAAVAHDILREPLEDWMGKLQWGIKVGKFGQHISSILWIELEPTILDTNGLAHDIVWHHIVKYTQEQKARIGCRGWCCTTIAGPCGERALQWFVNSCWRHLGLSWWWENPRSKSGHVSLGLGSLL